MLLITDLDDEESEVASMGLTLMTQKRRGNVSFLKESQVLTEMSSNSVLAVTLDEELVGNACPAHE